MKKSTAKNSEKNNDRIRLECLTKKSQNDTWEYEGRGFPEHVCGYGLGIYYEVSFKRQMIDIEYYNEGIAYKKYLIDFNGNLKSKL